MNALYFGIGDDLTDLIDSKITACTLKKQSCQCTNLETSWWMPGLLAGLSTAWVSEAHYAGRGKSSGNWRRLKTELVCWLRGKEKTTDSYLEREREVHTWGKQPPRDWATPLTLLFVHHAEYIMSVCGANKQPLPNMTTLLHSVKQHYSLHNYTILHV